MSTAGIGKRVEDSSGRRSRFVGVYYLLTIATGVFVLFFHGEMAFAADLFVAIFYLALTAFFYGLSMSANKARRH